MYYFLNRKNKLNLYRSILQPSFLLCLLFLYSCSDNESEQNTDTAITESSSKTSEKQQRDHTNTDETDNITRDDSDNQREIKTGKNSINKEHDYRSLLYKIAYGLANFSEVRISLSQDDIGSLTNTVHALNTMRWNRQVFRMMYDMWNMKTQLYPELAWDKISKPPVRIALASTILRIQSLKPLQHKDSHIYKAYIRKHKYDEHEFNRAQVVVALGLAGDPVDVPYLKEMVEGDNHYVTQSAITGLGLMNNKQASDTLIALYKQYRDDARADLILETLSKVYDLHPTTTPPKETK